MDCSARAGAARTACRAPCTAAGRAAQHTAQHCHGCCCRAEKSPIPCTLVPVNTVECPSSTCVAAGDRRVTDCERRRLLPPCRPSRPLRRRVADQRGNEGYTPGLHTAMQTTGQAATQRVPHDPGGRGGIKGPGQDQGARVCTRTKLLGRPRVPRRTPHGALQPPLPTRIPWPSCTGSPRST